MADYLILRERENLRTILVKLRGEPLTANRVMLIGTIENALRENGHIEVIVDEWPEISALVIRNRRTKPTLRVEPFYDFYMLEGSDPNKMYSLLRKGVINMEQPCFFYGVPKILAPALERVFSEDGKGELQHVGTTLTFIHNLKKSAKYGLNPPKGLKVSTIRDDEAEYVTSLWNHSYDRKLQGEALRYQIHHLPNICLRNDDDEIIACMSMRFHGTFGLGWVREDWRGKRVVPYLSHVFASKIRNDMKAITFGHVEDDNKSSLKSIRKRADEMEGDGVWYAYAPYPMESILSRI